VIRVPFVVAGPGIAPRSELAIVASFADVAPTLLELAG
jgi:arylsulfatase A-like enzyme